MYSITIINLTALDFIIPVVVCKTVTYLHPEAKRASVTDLYIDQWLQWLRVTYGPFVCLRRDEDVSLIICYYY